MKAAVTTGVKREIVVEEIPSPSVQPGRLLMKVMCCSICGTDLEYLDNSLAYRPGGALHAGAILGHEFSAKVAEIGEGVEGWSVGDRATLSGARSPCGECYFCRRRLYNLCLGKGNERAIYTEVTPGGYGHRFGALTEYILRPPSALLKLVEPLNVGVSSVKAAEMEPGDTAVIIGAGKIGLGTMMVAKIAGASPVIVIDIHKNRLDKATEMGADVVLNAQEGDVIPEIVKITKAGPDVVLICVRDGMVFLEAIDMVRRGGKIVVVGQIPPTEVHPGFWIPKQLKIEGVFAQSPMINALNLIARKQVNVKPMISEIIPLDEVQRAFDSLRSGKNIVSMVKP
jgi:(R,R)-butanediol dehydrogenase/meso-butanediol dehydrogenase/diacetyl reductase